MARTKTPVRTWTTRWLVAVVRSRQEPPLMPRSETICALMSVRRALRDLVVCGRLAIWTPIFSGFACGDAQVGKPARVYPPLFIIREMRALLVAALLIAAPLAAFADQMPPLGSDGKCGPADGVPSPTQPIHRACTQGIAIWKPQSATDPLWKWQCIGTHGRQGSGYCSAPKRSL